MTSAGVPRAAAVGLVALAGLHVAWAFGSSVPCRDRATLADTVAGTREMPAPAKCAAVAALLGVAAVLVGDVAPISTGMRRIGVAGVAVVLATRGGLGVTGRTERLVPWTPSDRFVELDRRYYGPLCLALAAGALAAGRDG